MKEGKDEGGGRGRVFRSRRRRLSLSLSSTGKQKTNSDVNKVSDAAHRAQEASHRRTQSRGKHACPPRRIEEKATPPDGTKGRTHRGRKNTKE